MSYGESNGHVTNDRSIRYRSFSFLNAYLRLGEFDFFF